ncbi:AAA family ATPase [Heyndrickxia sp. NPDC080065]|uniref:AAA family ATPase n=1 Tax=Heyndrickxia sp. NPDC080065 TaxID=3390568 RepID=UPI003D07E1A6
MYKLANYQLLEKIEENDSWILQRAYSQLMNRIVLVKFLKSDLPTSYEISSIVHEYYITQDLPTKNILFSFSLERSKTQPFLVMENFSGQTLKTILEKGKFSLTQFLKIAIQLADIIGELHKYHLIHKSIRPENILIDVHEGKTILSGFGHATKLTKENIRSVSSPYEINHHLSYMSPEQTGRMNRVIDYRTDLYSLGVTIYEMITGRLPFTTTDLAELVHAHLVLTPFAPHQVNIDIPETISMIIMKLIAKMPESRYQSAYGLRRDLEKCLQAVTQNHSILPFPLDEKEKIDHFELPPRLYARKKATELLHMAFKKTCAGIATFALIPGPSGIGKTALVKEVQKPLIQEKGYFISGKFDQLQRQKPYAPIIQAFKELLRQLLTEDPERIEKWRQSLFNDLSTHAGIITEVLPELEWLIGKHSKPQSLSVLETQSRFLMVFQKFVHVFAKKEHPLVLFLDDLQWADRASLDLVQYLLSEPVSQYLLVIGAYRDDEIKVGHPFSILLEGVQSTNVKICEIPLKPLEYHHIKQFISETFHNQVTELDMITTVIQRISQGNPFYVRQLVQALYEENIVTYDYRLSIWSTNIKLLNQLPLTGNIVEYMIKRVEKLPERTKRVLKFASCIGNQFELETLSTICESSFTKTSEDLWEALEEGLVLPLDPGYKWVYSDEMAETEPPAYRFSHDRVQQAVYVTMSKEAQEKTHLKIGRLLLKHLEETSHLDQLFEIVNHLNISRKHLIEGEEKEKLAKLNLSAGERAKQAAAFEAALKFYKVGLELLPNDSWLTQYDMTFKLNIGLGECEYLNSQFEDAEESFDTALANAQSKNDQLAVYEVKMTLYTHVHRVEEAVDAGIKGLQLFGWKVPRKPGKVTVMKEILLTKLALKKVNTKDLLELPPMEDEEKQRLMRTLTNMNGSAFHVDQYLATWLILRALRLTIKYGSTEISALTYNNYSLILCSGFLDFEGGYQFADLAIQHAQSVGNRSIYGRVYFLFGSFIKHWKDHLSLNLDYLRKSQSYCIESGNLHLAGANSSFIGMIMFMVGNPLQEVKEGINKQLEFVKQIRYTLSNYFLNEVKQWIRILMDPSLKSNWDLPKITDDLAALIIHSIIRLQMAYLLNKPKIAQELLTILEEQFNRSTVLVIGPEYYMYQSLWLVKFYPETSRLEQRNFRKKLHVNLKKLKKLAGHSPDNYKHKYLLVQAETARIENKKVDIAYLYDQAIELAEEKGYLQDLAIANECASSYYRSKGAVKLAEYYMTKAIQSYVKWGAKTKVNQLLQQNPKLMKESNESLQAEKLEYLDIKSITQASQTLSREIILSQLLEKIMSIVLKNAGAGRGLLLLQKEGDLSVVGKGSFQNAQEVIEVLSSKLSEQISSFSEMIVNYVVNSHEPVVEDDAANGGMFTKDPYIVKKRPKSILCLPIVHQGRLNGVLYLENNENTHAFTKERIEVLTLLSSQAAISIENAYLYANLENKVVERTIELETANQELGKAYQDITLSEQMRRSLLSNISHDLRTPITSIRGYIEAILDGIAETPEETKEYLQRTREKTIALNRLINDLFDLSQLEARQSSFEFDYIPIHGLVQHLYKQNELEVKNAGLVFELIFSNNDYAESPLVKVDIGRIEQAVSNIILNAIKHTKAGSIKLYLTIDSERNYTTITIQDSGSGIQEEDLPYIFNRYYTKPGGGNKKKGNGLGLSICKEIIAFHNGQLTVKSEIGKGTSFSIILPIFDVIDEMIDMDTEEVLYS